MTINGKEVTAMDLVEIALAHIPEPRRSELIALAKAQNEQDATEPEVAP